MLMIQTILTAALGTTLLLAIGLAGYKALYADTFGLDRALAALLFHAKAGETISYIVACWQRDGSVAGCRWCKFLSIAVEKDHCAKQFGSDPTPLFNGIRAGICLALFGLALAAVPYALGSAALAVWALLPN